MRSAGQSIDDDLEGLRVADLQPRCETAMFRTGPSGDHEVESNSFARTDRSATPPNYRDIKVEGQRVLVEPMSDGLAVRVGLIVSSLIAIGGLAWLTVGALPSVFMLRSESNEIVNSLSHDVEAQKGDRLPVQNTIISEGVAATSGEKSLGVYPPPPSEAKHSLDVQQQKIHTQLADAHRQATTSMHTNKNVPALENSMGARTRHLHTQAKLLPVPETRPATIEGWTLREVVNGKAVLEGPNGTWRVGRGDTVPGVGRVDTIFRWGNRLMVATSRGLIATR